MVLSVNLELFNPLNQRKEGVYGNIPSWTLTNLLFFCLQPLWFVASYFTAYPIYSLLFFFCLQLLMVRNKFLTANLFFFGYGFENKFSFFLSSYFGNKFPRTQLFLFSLFNFFFLLIQIFFSIIFIFIVLW